MTLSPQDKAAETPETDALAYENIKWVPGESWATQMDRHYAKLTAVARSLEKRLRVALSSRAPGAGLKRYACGDGGINEDSTGPFYLASEVDASLPREYTADNIGEAPEGVYRTGELIKGATPADDKWYWERWREMSKAQCVSLLNGIPGSEKYLRFFGPLPQPPRS